MWLQIISLQSFLQSNHLSIFQRLTSIQILSQYPYSTYLIIYCCNMSKVLTSLEFSLHPQKWPLVFCKHTNDAKVNQAVGKRIGFIITQKWFLVLTKLPRDIIMRKLCIEMYEKDHECNLQYQTIQRSRIFICFHQDWVRWIHSTMACLIVWTFNIRINE